MRTLSTRARLALPGAAIGLMHAVQNGASQGTPVTMDGTPGATPVPNDVSFAGIVDAMWDSIQEAFLLDDGLYAEHVPVRSDDRDYSYLWPFSTVLSAANARARLKDDDASKEDLRRTLEAAQAYFDAKGNPPGYDSYVVADGGGDMYYDDNQWLGIDFVYAYRTLGDETCLDRSRIVWELSVSGWSDDMGGGICWRENDTSTKNTCSNGPAAVHALLLYQETGEEEYLDWAQRIMTWLDDTLFDPNSGVYNDNINADGVVDPTKWTYNAGTPLHAYALLYDVTGDEQWLTRARELAAASHDYFASIPVQGAPEDVRRWPATPWFNSILHRGYEALYDVDPEPDPLYISILPALLRYGWEHARDTETGLLVPDWTARATSGAFALLDQPPVIEIAASAARLGL
jgi:hypothetical protein